MSNAARAVPIVKEASKPYKDPPPTVRISDFMKFKSLADLDIDEEVTLVVKCKVTSVTKETDGYNCLGLEIKGIKKESA